jgi:glutamate/tyrosine decarboxylase-like PLP-dependent enzyme
VAPSLPAAVPALFPPAAERKRIEEWLGHALAESVARAASGPIVPTLDVAAFRAELESFGFETPRPLEELLAWTLGRLEHGIVQMTHPRYLGLFNPSPNFPSQCADRVASAFNPQLASSGSSPIPVEIEAHVIRAVARRAGILEGASGHFATGGSEANCTALLAALTAAHPRFASDGVRAFSGPVAFYTSRDCHIAWLKIAHQCGIGRSALRLIDTDGRGRMDPLALSTAIHADRANRVVPVMIVATAGTTGSGMIDPLEACADLAVRERLWYHVDAAWGGAALASERLRGLLAGIERADSITIDAHKWFATTMGCALFITRRGAVLSEAFHASTSFMPTSVAALDPYLNSVQWSRRFVGLRLFLSLGSAGWAGYGAHVERAVAVAERLRAGLAQAGWEIVNDSPLAVVNAVPPPEFGDLRALVRRVVAGGRAWVASASFEGRDVVRLCATHGETRDEDVDEVLAVLTRPAADAGAR